MLRSNLKQARLHPARDGTWYMTCRVHHLDGHDLYCATLILTAFLFLSGSFFSANRITAFIQAMATLGFTFYSNSYTKLHTCKQ